MSKMKTKTIITDVGHFHILLTQLGYRVSTEGRNENSFFDLFKGDQTLVVCPVYAKRGGRYMHNGAGQIQLLGYQIRKPDVLLYKSERRNSGQITITFGKTIIEDVAPRIEQLFLDLFVFNQKKQIAKISADEANEWLEEKAKEFKSTESYAPRGFYLLCQPDVLVEQDLLTLGVEKVFYSYKLKKFVFTDKSLPKYFEIKVVQSSWGEPKLVEFETLWLQFETVRKINKLIETLNFVTNIKTAVQ